MRVGAVVAWTLGVTLIPNAESRGEPIAEEPPRVQSIVAVERGGFLEVDVGLAQFLNKLEDRTYGVAVTTAVFTGYDLLPILAISVGALTVAAPVSASPSVPLPRGDLFFIIPMARLQLALLTTERHFVWARVGGGFSFGLPGQIDDVDYGGSGPAFSASVGFERFTKLRHFSIGAEAGALMLTQPSLGFGVFLQPMLKYTF